GSRRGTCSAGGDGVRVFYEDGIVVQDGIKEIILDPARPTPGSIVSHGHLDHLTEGGVMTPETLEILKVRKGSSVATPLPYNREREVNGRSEEHTSELQSRSDLVCRLLLEKK